MTGAWNPATLLCRGLIVDAHDRIVARPFPKFFNWEEKQTADRLRAAAGRAGGGGDEAKHRLEVYEKLDGSLGILYFYGGRPAIATRGSFDSPQARHATGLLHGAPYRAALAALNPAYTYLFEIIYPENRVVVDYGTRNELVLLAVCNTATGDFLPWEQLQPTVTKLPFRVVPRVEGVSTLEELAEYTKKAG